MALFGRKSKVKASQISRPIEQKPISAIPGVKYIPVGAQQPQTRPIPVRYGSPENISSPKDVKRNIPLHSFMSGESHHVSPKPVPQQNGNPVRVQPDDAQQFQVTSAQQNGRQRSSLAVSNDKAARVLGIDPQAVESSGQSGLNTSTASKWRPMARSTSSNDYKSAPSPHRMNPLPGSSPRIGSPSTEIPERSLSEELALTLAFSETLQKEQEQEQPVQNTSSVAQTRHHQHENAPLQPQPQRTQPNDQNRQPVQAFQVSRDPQTLEASQVPQRPQRPADSQVFQAPQTYERSRFSQAPQSPQILRAHPETKESQRVESPAVLHHPEQGSGAKDITKQPRIHNGVPSYSMPIPSHRTPLAREHQQQSQRDSVLHDRIPPPETVPPAQAVPYGPHEETGPQSPATLSHSYHALSNDALSMRSSTTQLPQNQRNGRSSSISMHPYAILEGLKVNKSGRILDEEGDPIGELFEGDIMDCVRQRANDNGEVLDEYGRVVGRVRLLQGAAGTLDSPALDAPAHLQHHRQSDMFEARQKYRMNSDMMPTQPLPAPSHFSGPANHAVAVSGRQDYSLAPIVSSSSKVMPVELDATEPGATESSESVDYSMPFDLTEPFMPPPRLPTRSARRSYSPPVKNAQIARGLSQPAEAVSSAGPNVVPFNEVQQESRAESEHEVQPQPKTEIPSKPQEPIREQPAVQAHGLLEPTQQVVPPPQNSPLLMAQPLEDIPPRQASPALAPVLEEEAGDVLQQEAGMAQDPALVYHVHPAPEDIFRSHHKSADHSVASITPEPPYADSSDARSASESTEASSSSEQLHSSRKPEVRRMSHPISEPSAFEVLEKVQKRNSRVETEPDPFFATLVRPVGRSTSENNNSTTSLSRVGTMPILPETDATASPRSQSSRGSVSAIEGTSPFTRAPMTRVPAKPAFSPTSSRQNLTALPPSPFAAAVARANPTATSPNRLSNSRLAAPQSSIMRSGFNRNRYSLSNTPVVSSPLSGHRGQTLSTITASTEDGARSEDAGDSDRFSFKNVSDSLSTISAPPAPTRPRTYFTHSGRVTVEAGALPPSAQKDKNFMPSSERPANGGKLDESNDKKKKRGRFSLNFGSKKRQTTAAR